MHNNKDRIAFFLLFTIVLLGFSSCKSTAESRENPLYVWLTNDAKFILLPNYNRFPISVYNLVVLGQALETVGLFFADTGTNRPVFARNVYECRSCVVDRQHNHASQRYAAAKMILGDIPCSWRQKSVRTEVAEYSPRDEVPAGGSDKSVVPWGIGRSCGKLNRQI